MRILSYLLITTLLIGGCGSVVWNLFFSGRQDETPNPTQEKVRNVTKWAEQGYVEAQYLLGMLYFDQGKGIPQDYQEALKWFRKSAEQGFVEAQFNLGVIYRDGYGVPKDDQEAIKWWRKSAEQGHSDAQTNLGVMYHNGEGVPKDYVLAYKWVNLAAAQGDEQGVKLRDKLAKRMTPSQIKKAEKLALEFKPKKEKP